MQRVLQVQAVYFQQGWTGPEPVQVTLVRVLRCRAITKASILRGSVADGAVDICAERSGHTHGPQQRQRLFALEREAAHVTMLTTKLRRE